MSRHAVIRDGVVENAIVLDPGAQWTPPAGASVVACSDSVARGWTYADGVFALPQAPTPTFAQLITAKGSAIAAAYAAAVARGYEHRGKVIQIDSESRQNIDSMALLARLVLNNVDGAEWPADLAEKGWRTLDNTHLPMTPEQMVAMSFGVSSHFVAIRFRASALKDALAAAVAAQGADAIAAIDPSTGWPA